MDNPIIIEAKKRVFTEAVMDACDALHLPVPEINFSGDDDNNPNELAHSHPDLYKICISERQLKLQDSAGLKETANHEMTHLIGMIEHGKEFEKVKNQLILKGWKPPKSSGIQFIDGYTINEQSNQIRNDPEEYAKVNEDSDLVKFLEGKASDKQTTKERTPTKELETDDSRIEDTDYQETKKAYNKTNHSKIDEAGIGESRIKTGLNMENGTANSFDDIIICQRNGCNKKAVAKCKYCNEAFCEEHKDPVLVMSTQEVWSLNQIRKSDPEKYEKYTKDWKRTDGHPCPAYTIIWNKKHEAELKNRYNDFINFNYEKYFTNTNGKYINKVSKPLSLSKNIMWVLIIIIVIIVILLYKFV
ncbi:membrane protein [Candidatus Mancarchaeum acidiphilum]|uniref:Membrane protein n=1 Tax=Candidatus Mancarchaeum acidiphilum TaxID=1920749 RepID=A0A218NMS7_9ARCH|nr:hypothetical protein [Candidatus Mancarchaeum acidiphilum]ASI13754.1 membrane protein [Candidatus Mancarchaeum acidiphilum]